MRQSGVLSRWWVAALAGVLVSTGLVACTDAKTEETRANEEPVGEPTGTGVAIANGRIVFMRGDPSEGGGIAFTVDPDGSDERELVPEFPNSEFPSWSPDGSEIHVFCCDDGMVAHFVDPDTGDLVRALPPPDPALEIYCGGAWSPDGRRVACGGFGAEDPNLNGIYSIRASDGRGLERITSIRGGEDMPGDYSPDGERLVFVRWIDGEPAGFFVTELDGSGLLQISPRDLILDDAGFAGSWSPAGDQILFVARESVGHHKAIWVVNADGSLPHQLEIDDACGGRLSDAESVGCYSPAWSPDGSQIVFTRSSPGGSAVGFVENIYIVNADGTGLLQVTDGGVDDNPDWGAPPDGS